jgi:hypothetical protein
VECFFDLGLGLQAAGLEVAFRLDPALVAAGTIPDMLARIATVSRVIAPRLSLVVSVNLGTSSNASSPDAGARSQVSQLTLGLATVATSQSSLLELAAMPPVQLKVSVVPSSLVLCLLPLLA